MAQRTVTVPEYVVTDRVEVNPKTTALLIVDMQNDFVKEGGKLVVPTAKDTVPAIRQLLDLARQHGMFVAYTQDTHLPNDPEFPIWGEHCLIGTWGWEIVDELKPQPNELVVQKRRYDGFYGTTLEHDLRVAGVDTLIESREGAGDFGLSDGDETRERSDEFCWCILIVAMGDGCGATCTPTRPTATGNLP
jgi:isochorismate hydrolase